MLETLNPRKVNIKNLTTIPDREDELPWDFEKAINDKEWRLLITALESQKEDKNWSSFAELASDMQLLFPAGASSLGLDINAFAGILGTINEHEKMGHWEHVAKYSARKLVDSDLIANLPLIISLAFLSSSSATFSAAIKSSSALITSSPSSTFSSFNPALTAKKPVSAYGLK